MCVSQEYASNPSHILIFLLISHWVLLAIFAWSIFWKNDFRSSTIVVNSIDKKTCIICSWKGENRILIYTQGNQSHTISEVLLLWLKYRCFLYPFIIILIIGSLYFIPNWCYVQILEASFEVSTRKPIGALKGY